MTYSHSTNHSFKPNIEFWKAIENLFRSFPYWEQPTILSKFDKTQLNKLTRYCEKRTFETFKSNAFFLYADKNFPIFQKLFSIAS